MGTAILLLLNPARRDFWLILWALMATVCLLNPGSRRLLESKFQHDKHLFFLTSSISLPFQFLFFFLFSRSPFILPRQPFSLSFFHSLHFLIWYIHFINDLTCSPFFPLHRPSSPHDSLYLFAHASSRYGRCI